MKSNSKTPMIKARAYNQISRMFHHKDELNEMSDIDKIAKIYEIFAETRPEIKSYRTDLKKKTEVESLRIARGYKKKRKTSLATYNAMQLGKEVEMDNNLIAV